MKMMKDTIKEIEGGVCSPKGFKAGAIHCGIKKNGGTDLALIASDVLAAAAGVYTKNKVKGAPIAVTKKNIEDGKAKAIICNSGNANTCAPNGMFIAEKTCELLGAALNCKGEDIIVASTGVIGVPMEIQPFETGIPQLVEKIHDKGANEAAVGIMTTDTKEKEIAVEFMVGNTLCKLGGMAKGSGMIHPNMATMLSFITGDTKISGEMLQQALSEVVEDTFNQVSVDGDTSTNDTVAILCNGLAGNEEIAQEGEAYDQFKAALLWVMTVLSKEIAADGEGAGKLMEVEVFGAPDVKVARLVAKSIISSSLFKAALFGEDANWGRILCAIGYTDAEFSADNISVEMESAGGKLLFCENSGAVGFSEEKAKKILKEDQVRFIIDLNDGDGHAFAWGCDLTYDYVKINGDYRS